MTLDAAIAAIRTAPDTEQITTVLEQLGNSALTKLCRRLGLIQTGSMHKRRQRVLRATMPLDRAALAASALVAPAMGGESGMAGLRAQISAALGRDESQQLTVAEVGAVMASMDEVTLRRLLPGSPFADGYSALRLQFLLGARQYALTPDGTAVFRTETGSFQFYCAPEEWPTSSAMREWREVTRR